MFVGDPQREAEDLYEQFVTGTGFSPPETAAELLLFVELSGCYATCRDDAAPGFDGIQIGNWAHASGAPWLTDRQRMTRLAHEWGHCLRRRTDPSGERARLYLGDGLEDNEVAVRDLEEEIARCFERLF